MKSKILLCLLAVASHSLWADQTVTDMFGRSVTLPDVNEIEVIFSGNPIASVFLYSLAPDLLANWNFKMAPTALQMFPEAYRSLPVQGTLWGSSKPASDEEILKLNPSFILIMGPKKSSLSDVCDTVQERLHIPVLYLDNDLDKTAEAYELLGSVLGREERAAVLGDYAVALIEETREFSESLSEGEKRNIYYSLSEQGLNTYPAGVANAALIELCGGNNIIKLNYDRKSGPMTVSFEEVIMGQPDIIIAGHASRADLNDGSLYTKGKWAALEAEVAIVPHAPFNAFDKPPSVNQLAGIVWLRKILYPSEFAYDPEEEMNRFYSLFFHM
ncbi:MAG: hypothetical protein PQJ60_07675 [Spirochaetales bacterium]|nr:hypothetical protein [Spirochaetales bacterium]